MTVTVHGRLIAGKAEQHSLVVEKGGIALRLTVAEQVALLPAVVTQLDDGWSADKRGVERWRGTE